MVVSPSTISFPSFVIRHFRFRFAPKASKIIVQETLPDSAPKHCKRTRYPKQVILPVRRHPRHHRVSPVEQGRPEGAGVRRHAK
jgi:hypothetical protein